MHAGFFDVLHDAADDHFGAVGEGVDVDFGGFFQKLIDEHGTRGTHHGGLRYVFLHGIDVVGDDHRPAAENVAGANQHGQADFARDPRGEGMWPRLIAPALAAVLLAAIVVLAVQHYALLLGVAPGSPAVWILPGAYAAVAAAGLGWGLILKLRRPHIYAAIGLGAHAVTTQPSGRPR